MCEHKLRAVSKQGLNALSVYPLPYKQDLIDHYQAFCELDGFVLLESRDKAHGRYDILTALPYDRFRVSRTSLDPHEVSGGLQQKLPKRASMGKFPFQGGAIGYISYDFGAAMMGIHKPSHPLLHDMPLIDLAFYDWAIIVDHTLKQVHLLTSNQQQRDELRERWFDYHSSTAPFSLQTPFTPIMAIDAYRQAFQTIHQALREGRAYQVNLTQAFLAEYLGNAWGMYTNIRLKNPVPYSAFLRTHAADILSFSPERFLTIDEGQVLTSPIKGTARRSQDVEMDKALQDALMACPKNRAENVMIVDLLRNDLGRFAKPGSVNVSSLCELQSFHAVHHLVSDIEAICKDNISPLQAFLACFPGGSITGAPKLESMRIISENEPFGRGVYCGSIAYFSSHGRVDSSIAIRTITAKNQQLYLAAGGGIVMDSNCEDEYQECFTKIAAFIACGDR